MAKKPKLDCPGLKSAPMGEPIPTISGAVYKRPNGTTYVVYDDIPLERFENFVMPPMPAKDVVMLLAGISPFDYSRISLPSDTAAEVRRLLVDNMMPENPNADRTEIEAFIDERIAEVRATLSA